MNSQAFIKLISRLLMAFGVMLVNAFLFTLLAQWLVGLIFNENISEYIGASNYSNPTLNQISAARFFVVISSIGTFIVTSLVLTYLFRQKPVEYLGFSSFPKPIFLLMVPVLLISAMPFLSWLVELNGNIRLPSFLANLEEQLKAFEKSNDALYKLLFGQNTLSDAMVNLFVMGLIPAVGEELFCRGVLLNIMFDYNGKMLKSILIVALIFTLFHLQFYKFMPMMSLAILLGLFITWTQSIWASIFFHFLNNTFAVFGAYFEHQGVKNMMTDSDAHIPTYLGLLSLFASLAIIVWLNQYVKKKSETVIVENENNQSN